MLHAGDTPILHAAGTVPHGCLWIRLRYPTYFHCYMRASFMTSSRRRLRQRGKGLSPAESWLAPFYWAAKMWMNGCIWSRTIAICGLCRCPAWVLSRMFLRSPICIESGSDSRSGASGRGWTFNGTYWLRGFTHRGPPAWCGMRLFRSSHRGNARWRENEYHGADYGAVRARWDQTNAWFLQRKTRAGPPLLDVGLFRFRGQGSVGLCKTGKLRGAWGTDMAYPTRDLSQKTSEMLTWLRQALNGM